MTHIESPASLPRPWRYGMTPEQRGLAAELHARAERLRQGAAEDGGLSIREAVELAAVQMGLSR